MATSVIKNNSGLIDNSRVSIILANTNIMTLAGGVELYQLDDKNFLGFVSVGITYSSNRSADMSAWGVSLDGQQLAIQYPYFVPFILDGSSNAYFSYRTDNNLFYKNPIAVSANQRLRWSGAVRFTKD